MERDVAPTMNDEIMAVTKPTLGPRQILLFGSGSEASLRTKMFFRRKPVFNSKKYRTY